MLDKINELSCYSLINRSTEQRKEALVLNRLKNAKIDAEHFRKPMLKKKSR